jgi:hypothetical protein
MGLDAVVYRKRANLPFDPDAVGAVVDEQTDEYYVPDLDVEPACEEKFPRDTRIALHKWIGNIALVAELRERASELLDDRRSIVLSKVLCSGTPGGDSISLGLTPVLHAQLLRLGRYAEQTGDDFLSGSSTT